MERVTLGAVGDSYVGKTLLLVSYTANYVYKEYKPTVLNSHWTTVITGNDVVELRIWDSSGADEYIKHRPLSYPQTDVFLVCFSLKCRASFENVERKWIPEIQEHVDSPRFIIVGCKRDDCLISSRENIGIDLITTKEGEQMATRLGAVKYVETSAIQQSGFTDCFTTAINTALDRQRQRKRRSTISRIPANNLI